MNTDTTQPGDPLLKEMDKQQALTCDLQKISKMFLSTDHETMHIAKLWLTDLIGKTNAEVNLFVLSFYIDYENGCEYCFDQKRYWKIDYSPYCCQHLKNQILVETEYQFMDFAYKQVRVYGQQAIERNIPKDDFIESICREFEKKYTLQQVLFKTAIQQMYKITIVNLNPRPNPPILFFPGPGY